ncbi:MAG TPA: hypothetical protein EYQ64_05465 [Gemmatimonadetes bacterium]|nr:hypothetical protein [Gemmatimonadota bacterium]
MKRHKGEEIYMGRGPMINLLSVSLILGASLGCEPPGDLALPTESEAEAHYASSTDLSVRVTGNIVEVSVEQPLAQVRRGGSLWVKVGPYIYLFTEETESLLQSYPGLSGVRVITRTNRSRSEVARAFLHRESLNEITWRRAKNIAGKARTDGTRRPVLLEDLVDWGQEHTDFAYSEEFVK